MNFSGTKPHGKLILFSISYSTASGCCFFSRFLYQGQKKAAVYVQKKALITKPQQERHASVNFLK